jgi:uncharacterized protein YlxW (UPF0749 family)
MNDNINELYDYYMKNYQNCSRYSMAEFIHRQHNEIKKLRSQIFNLQQEVKKLEDLINNAYFDININIEPKRRIELK